MDPYGKILGRLRKLRPCQRPLTWSACCPAHDDRSPSLLVWVGRTGCLIARCLAGKCVWPEIVAALGTEYRDWFPPRDHWDQQRRWKVAEKVIRETYAYRDRDGVLRYQTVRYEPKEFKQRRPNPTHPEGWVWNLEGVEPLPYRLPELLAARDQPVIVVEGEKDVESLRAIGLIATCNHGGALKWHPDLGRHLTGRRCVVIPDADDVGERHGQFVVGNLLRWGAASVRYCRLPAEHGCDDVSDWLAGRLPNQTDQQMRSALCAFIRKCPEYGAGASARASGRAGGTVARAA